MAQTSFLPVQITHQEPYGGQTADLRLVGYTSDRIKYAIKRESDARLLPLAEWIGHNLCRMAGVYTPEFTLVTCIDGEIAFGSRWEESATQINEATPIQERLLLLKTHATDISAIHAVDQMYANPDRHPGNLLFVVRSGIEMCLAFDFSRAGPRNGLPFGTTPLPPDCLTMVIMDIIKDYLNAFDGAVYKDVIDSLERISSSDFRTVLDNAPDNWFTAIDKEDLLSWWDNERSIRLEEARQWLRK